MMVATGWLAGHPELGELLCFIDRSMPAVEQEQVAAHVTECEHCQRELALLEGQVRIVSASMASLGTESVSDIRRARALKAVSEASRQVSRRRRWRTVILPKLAAASVVLFAVFVAAGPGLALMRSIFGKPAVPVIAPPTVVSRPAAIVPDVRNTVSHVFTDSVFVLDFERLPAGILELKSHSAGEAELRIPSGWGLMLRPGGALIENRSLGEPIFSVTLPSGVSRITIRIPGRRPVSIQPGALKRFDLSELASGANPPNDVR